MESLIQRLTLILVFATVISEITADRDDRCRGRRCRTCGPNECLSFGRCYPYGSFECGCRWASDCPSGQCCGWGQCHAVGGGACDCSNCTSTECCIEGACVPRGSYPGACCRGSDCAANECCVMGECKPMGDTSDYCYVSQPYAWSRPEEMVTTYDMCTCRTGDFCARISREHPDYGQMGMCTWG